MPAVTHKCCWATDGACVGLVPWQGKLGCGLNANVLAGRFAEWTELLNHGKAKVYILQCERRLTTAEKQRVRDWWRNGGQGELFPIMAINPRAFRTPAEIIARMDRHIAKLRAYR